MPLEQRVADKVIKLRQLATIEGIHGEAYNLFKKIEEDPTCNSILWNSSSVDNETIKNYNRNIKESKLPSYYKRNLTI